MPDKTEINEVINDRHKEASEVKHCFTDFAFKGLLLATAFFGAIIKFYPTNAKNCVPYILTWLFLGVVILVLLRIVRIGFHKYSTANRNYGYVLHLDRTYDYEGNIATDIEETEIRQVGWEEAMFAWRVIQPIIYEEIYKNKTPKERFFFPLFGIERYFSNSYHWWNTEYLMNFQDNQNSTKKYQFVFHPGSYLEKTQKLIHGICIVIYIIFSFSYFTECSSIYKLLPAAVCTEPSIFKILYITIWCFCTLIFAVQIIQQCKERHILEKGLLSIQSCAVVWRLVVISHLKAVKNEAGYKGYTRRLVENACIINNNLFSIHETLMKNKWPPTQDQNIIPSC